MIEDRPGLPSIPFTTVTENLKAHLNYFRSYGRNWRWHDIEAWMADHEIMLVHGSRGHYTTGCRHEWCKEAERRYNRRRRAAGLVTARRDRRAKFVTSIREDAL